MAFRRAPQGPHYNPAPPVNAARRASSLGPMQNIRNSLPMNKGTGVSVAYAKTVVTGVNRSVANLFSRLSR